MATEIPKDLILGHKFAEQPFYTYSTTILLIKTFKCTVCDLVLDITDDTLHPFVILTNNEFFYFDRLLPSQKEKFYCNNILIKSIIL
jgi:hypothetical protein